MSVHLDLKYAREACDEANEKLAKIREALDWDVRSSTKCVAIREILAGSIEHSEPTV